MARVSLLKFVFLQTALSSKDERNIIKVYIAAPDEAARSFATFLL
jgi:hypothetical protein